jgi:hypothetical protein
MKKSSESGRMGKAWSGEIGRAVEKSRLFVCLIRSVLVLSE